MEDFLKFLEDKVQNFPMHVEITYSTVTDWSIYIYKKNCASDYPEAKHNGSDVIIVDVQDNDMELAFARAHVQLKEWLLQFDGGY